VGAGSRRGHHRDRCHTGQCAGGFDKEQAPQRFPFSGECRSEERGVFGDRRKPEFPARVDLFRYNPFITGFKAEDAGDNLPVRVALVHKRLISGRDPAGCSLRRVGHHRHTVPVDVGDDLVTQYKEGFLVGFLVFMNMNRRDCKGTITAGWDFIVSDTFIVLFDMDHQHVEME
jgi:hypothetical protein